MFVENLSFVARRYFEVLNFLKLRYALMADNQISTRHPNKADLAKMANLLTRVFTFDGLVLVQSHEELEEEFSGPYCHLENDVIVVEQNSEIIGIGYTIFLPSETREERCYIFGGVDPDFRRQGIGTSIMNWAMQHGKSQLQSTGRKIPKYLRTDVIKSNESAKQLFTKFEMRPVRWNDDLIIDLNDAPTALDNSSCSIVSWDSARDEEARIVKNLAFADHWGSTPTTKEGWEQMVHGSTARLDHSFLHSIQSPKLLVCFFLIDMSLTIWRLKNELDGLTSWLLFQSTEESRLLSH